MKRRKWPWVLCGIVIVIAVVLFVKRDLVRMVFYSNYDPENRLSVENWTGGTAHMGVRYADVSESDYLNLYVPDGVENPPLLVLIHGGGFVVNDCESRQAQLFYQYFRDHGYACATVNYRLAGEAIFPAAVQDVKAAIRFLKANAETYGYDASKVTVWGESAGGYLAVMAGATNDEEFNDLPFIGEDALPEPVSSRVDVVLDYYGAVQLESKAERAAAFRALGVPAFIVDLAAGWLKAPIKDLPWAETCEDAWMGKPFDALTEEENRAVQPIYYVRKNLNGERPLAMLIWHGDADITVPVTQSRLLYDTLKAQNGADPLVFEVIHNAKHAGERMYTDQSLARVQAFLEDALKK